MKRVFIAGNREKPGCREAAREAARHLAGRARVAGTDLSKSARFPTGRVDLVLCLGGDGAFLNLVPQVLARDLPVLGVNFGRLGFLTAGLSRDMTDLLDAWLAGRMEESRRMTLAARMPGARAPVPALNDVVVCSGDLARVVTLRVSVGRERPFPLRGDGLIIATPTGSTAHSLSAGGALLDAGMDAIQLTPMAPQSLSSRPLVVPADERVTVELPEGVPAARVVADGRDLGRLAPGQSLVVSRGRRRCRICQPTGYSFYRRLREKLGWKLESGPSMEQGT